jgi:hypothetical protein
MRNRITNNAVVVRGKPTPTAPRNAVIFPRPQYLERGEALDMIQKAANYEHQELTHYEDRMTDRLISRIEQEIREGRCTDGIPREEVKRGMRDMLKFWVNFYDDNEQKMVPKENLYTDRIPPLDGFGIFDNKTRSMPRVVIDIGIPGMRVINSDKLIRIAEFVGGMLANKVDVKVWQGTRRMEMIEGENRIMRAQQSTGQALSVKDTLEIMMKHHLASCERMDLMDKVHPLVDRLTMVELETLEPSEDMLVLLDGPRRVKVVGSTGRAVRLGASIRGANRIRRVHTLVCDAEDALWGQTISEFVKLVKNALLIEYVINNIVVQAVKGASTSEIRIVQVNDRPEHLVMYRSLEGTNLRTADQVTVFMTSNGGLSIMDRTSGEELGIYMKDEKGLDIWIGVS